MKIKYFVFIFILGVVSFSFVKTNTSLAVTTPVPVVSSAYCRVTGSLSGISRSSTNPSVFVMLYKIQKVEQLRVTPGYDCHGFVVGATAGIGLDSGITDTNFSIKVGQNFIADFDPNDNFLQFYNQPILTTCLDLQNDLVYGNKNSDVTELQQFLIDKGYLNTQATGYFGLMTKNALISFQKDNSLVSSGRLDLNTRAKVKELTCSTGVVKAKLGEACNTAIQCETNLYCAYDYTADPPTGQGTCQHEAITMKPVIYLYPENKQQVSVKLFYDGILNASLPDYDKKINGWNVTAYPDGKIINSDGREYSYLFWEGKDDVKYDMSSGFIVKGSDTKEFLHNILSKMGLTPKEYNEFIVFWYPKMKNNAYNIIHFADKEYTDNAKLDITPKPDSIQRVFMVWKGLDNPINIKTQDIKSFTRKGFTVIEWGGEEL